MNNVLSYHDAYSDLRRAVKAARAEFQKEVERATPYLPSEKAQEDIEAAKADFEAALEAARATARPKFDRAIDGMRGHVAAPDMTAPTQDMLSILTMLDMRDSVEADEIESAAKAMGNNDAALRTLRDVLQRKGKAMPTSVKTFEARTCDAVDTMQAAAIGILQWDGRTGEQVLSDYFSARNASTYGNGEPPTHNALASRSVADVEAGATHRDTARAIIGGDVAAEVIDALG